MRCATRSPRRGRLRWSGEAGHSSISIPQRDTDGFDAEGFKNYLARAEELGFEGGWTLEQTIGPTPHLRRHAVPVFGTPDEVVRGLREVVDAGAEMILLNPTGETVAEDREQMERLAAEVIPQLSWLTAFAEY